jgi:hypothetical protein
MGCPTSSYATAGIALRVSGALKPHHHDKVETSSVGILVSTAYKNYVYRIVYSIKRVIPSYIKVNVHTLIIIYIYINKRESHMTHRQHGDRISLLSISHNTESRLRTRRRRRRDGHEFIPQV